MTELITYKGGGCGDFLRYLIHQKPLDLDKNDIIELGKVCTETDLDFTRPVFDLIYSETVETLYDKALRYKNKMLRRQPYRDCKILTSHDLWAFYQRYRDLSEFFRFIEMLEIDRILYVCITTKKSSRIRHANSLYKLHGHTIETAKPLLDRYSSSALKVEYIPEYNSYLDLKRDCDIMIELECIYDKEYLRNFLKNNYDGWSDTNFDAVYDYYMALQPWEAY